MKSMPRKKLFLLILLCAGITSTALAFISPGDNTAKITPTQVEAASQELSETKSADQTERVKSESLWPQLRPSLRALGDRLEKQGKERLTLAGTLVRGTSEQGNQFLLTWEYPGRLRIEEASGGRSQVLLFDGTTLAKPDGALTTEEEVLLETFLYDTAEHFFVSQMRGAATRHLGSRFRLTEVDEFDSEYQGPVYDLYEVTEPVTVGGQERQQSRQYLFNSDTHLLERVRYETARNGLVVKVEVIFSDWQKVAGQMSARSIQRTEDGEPVFTLSIGSFSVSARAEDGLFQTQKNQ